MLLLLCSTACAAVAITILSQWITSTYVVHISFGCRVARCHPHKRWPMYKENYSHWNVEYNYHIQIHYYLILNTVCVSVCRRARHYYETIYANCVVCAMHCIRSLRVCARNYFPDCRLTTLRVQFITPISNRVNYIAVPIISITLIPRKLTRNFNTAHSTTP